MRSPWRVNTINTSEGFSGDNHP